MAFEENKPTFVVICGHLYIVEKREASLHKQLAV